MHEFGTEGRAVGIQQTKFCRRVVAAIDILKLDDVRHQPYIAEVDGELAAVVMHFGHDGALNGDVSRLVRGVGKHLYLFIERAQQLGIEGDGYFAS